MSWYWYKKLSKFWLPDNWINKEANGGQGTNLLYRRIPIKNVERKWETENHHYKP